MKTLFVDMVQIKKELDLLIRMIQAGKVPASRYQELVERITEDNSKIIEKED